MPSCFAIKQILNIEAEAIQLLFREDPSRCGGLIELESALRVEEGQASGRAHNEVEDTAGVFTPGGLVDADQGPIERTGTDRDLRILRAAAADSFATSSMGERGLHP